MIYVKRDPALIPEKVLKVAERAQEKLESLPVAQRKLFIEKKSHVWRAFGKFLSKMSYGKCWYSESNDPQSFFDVDHFRPKKEAKRSEIESDDGYPWLAFSWENFRYAAGRSNRLSTDEQTDEVVGKGSWFPLCDGSKVATWGDRCIGDEKPILLDPAKRSDVRLIAVGATGKMEPSKFCLGKYQALRVTESAKYFGLDLPRLVEARQRAMRDVQESIEQVMRVKVAADQAGDQANIIADALPIDVQLENIQKKTHPREPYAAAIRAQLHLMGFGDVCLRVEDLEVVN